MKESHPLLTELRMALAEYADELREEAQKSWLTNRGKEEYLEKARKIEELVDLLP